MKKPSSNVLLTVPRAIDLRTVNYVDPRPRWPVLPAYHISSFMWFSPEWSSRPEWTPSSDFLKRNDGEHTPERCVPFKVHRHVDIETVWVLCEFSPYGGVTSRFSIWGESFLVPVTSISLVITLYGDIIPWGDRVRRAHVRMSNGDQH